MRQSGGKGARGRDFVLRQEDGAEGGIFKGGRGKGQNREKWRNGLVGGSCPEKKEEDAITCEEKLRLRSRKNEIKAGNNALKNGRTGGRDHCPISPEFPDPVKGGKS